jgi:hypothetical protein
MSNNAAGADCWLSATLCLSMSLFSQFLDQFVSSESKLFFFFFFSFFIFSFIIETNGFVNSVIIFLKFWKNSNQQHQNFLSELQSRYNCVWKYFQENGFEFGSSHNIHQSTRFIFHQFINYFGLNVRFFFFFFFLFFFFVFFFYLFLNLFFVFFFLSFF